MTCSAWKTNNNNVGPFNTEWITWLTFLELKYETTVLIHTILFSGISSKVTCFQSAGCSLIARHSRHTRARPHSSTGFRCWNISNKVALLRWDVMRLDWGQGTPPSMKRDDSDSSYFQGTSWRPCLFTGTEVEQRTKPVHEWTKAKFYFSYLSYKSLKKANTLQIHF